MLYIVSIFAEAQKERLLECNPQLHDYIVLLKSPKQNLYVLVQARPTFIRIELSKFNDGREMREIIPVSIVQDTEAVTVAQDERFFIAKHRGDLTEELVQQIVGRTLAQLPPVYMGKLITRVGAVLRHRLGRGESI